MARTLQNELRELGSGMTYPLRMNVTKLAQRNMTADFLPVSIETNFPLNSRSEPALALNSEGPAPFPFRLWDAKATALVNGYSQ